MFEKKRSTRKKYRVSGFLLILCLLMSLLTAGCGSSPADSLTGESHIITSVQEAETEQTTETEQLAETEQLTEVEQTTEIEQTTESDPSAAVREDGQYTTRDEVALYIHLYGHLPDNYITKREAQDLGWDSRSGNLWDVADGKSIGGDKFGNYEGLLPEAQGRTWRECDIGYEGGYRGAERILYSSDGLIYYTDDHYESFTCLYGEE